jgi:GR25 family glycosyltransferase involved in LPS biosynthesis
MIEILSNININNKRIPAVDGKLLPKSKIYSQLDNIDYSRTVIEYACLLSHLNAIKTFNLSKHNIALILEDDISLEYLKYWNESICDIIYNAPEDWEVIMLNYQAFYYLNDTYTLNYKGRVSCAQAYLINKRGSNKLINILFKNNKYVLTNCNIHTADNYIFCILKTYIYKYPYFTYPTENDSTIHTSHLDFHKYGKDLAFHSWKNKYNEIYNPFMPFNKFNPFLRILLVLFIIIIYILLLVKKK